MYDVVTGHVGTIWIFSCLTVFSLEVGAQTNVVLVLLFPTALGFNLWVLEWCAVCSSALETSTLCGTGTLKTFLLWGYNIWLINLVSK
jgi:tetrahydromethanopterin S-methyltransferase subunit E